MFEIIGYITVSLVVLIFLWIQYFIIDSHSYHKNETFIKKFVGVIPLLPFIIIFIITFYYIMEMLYKRFVRWFELNFGWFFVNGRKRDEWARYLREKYKD